MRTAAAIIVISIALFLSVTGAVSIASYFFGVGAAAVIASGVAFGAGAIVGAAAGAVLVFNFTLEAWRQRQ